ncbi:MAG: leucyl aminopeptidase family protein [Myxococcales bacterium]|nr:leucyl aminopeptidase family protein [Myxococcales bacterium]MCB9733601.1 hypothetical protein [Deltaproteobacteria bacterium]
MTTPAPATRLSLKLLPEGGPEPAGARVSAKGGLAVGARFGDDGAHVELRLASRPVAELRWLVDGALKKLRGAFGLDSAALEVDAGVDGAVADAIALDLLQAHGGRVSHGRGEAIDRLAASETLFKRWVDEDAATRTSTAIARDVSAWVAANRGDHPVAVEILDHDACKEEGLRLLCAVGGASLVSPPTLVTATYRPEGSTRAPLMLLGKGITFDSGGINVKPYESYVSMMKNDMAGAALAWALFQHLVASRFPWPLVCVIPTCENPIGEGAMRPGALVKSYRGLTVRIDHTDAEGRLVLADGLAWAGDRHQPERVISFATLTTAALIAYGPYATPVHFAPPALEAALTRASARTGEDLHFFPERIWHLEANRDEEADVKNTARLPGHASRGAGSRNAGHFLLHFTDRPLTHLDIFASTWNWAGDAPAAGTGATGAPLRTLVHGLEGFAADNR